MRVFLCANVKLSMAEQPCYSRCSFPVPAASSFHQLRRPPVLGKPALVPGDGRSDGCVREMDVVGLWNEGREEVWQGYEIVTVSCYHMI